MFLQARLVLYLELLFERFQEFDFDQAQTIFAEDRSKSLFVSLLYVIAATQGKIHPSNSQQIIGTQQTFARYNHIKMSKKILHIMTGNKGKIQEFQELLGSEFDLKFKDIDLKEMQGDPEQIALMKVRQAYQIQKQSILIDDGSLCFAAYGGLPGQYIKWFLKELGAEGLQKMLQAFQDKRATAICILAYMGEEQQNPKLFIGSVDGIIVKPRGQQNCGWYSIFQPNGETKTLGQMSHQQRNKHTHRFFACQKLRKHFLA